MRRFQPSVENLEGKNLMSIVGGAYTGSAPSLSDFAQSMYKANQTTAVHHIYGLAFRGVLSGSTWTWTSVILTDGSQDRYTTVDPVQSVAPLTVDVANPADAGDPVQSVAEVTVDLPTTFTVINLGPALVDMGSSLTIELPDPDGVLIYIAEGSLDTFICPAPPPQGQ